MFYVTECIIWKVLFIRILLTCSKVSCYLQLCSIVPVHDNNKKLFYHIKMCVDLNSFVDKKMHCIDLAKLSPLECQYFNSNIVIMK